MLQKRAKNGKENSKRKKIKAKPLQLRGCLSYINFTASHLPVVSIFSCHAGVDLPPPGFYRSLADVRPDQQTVNRMQPSKGEHRFMLLPIYSYGLYMYIRCIYMLITSCSSSTRSRRHLSSTRSVHRDGGL